MQTTMNLLADMGISIGLSSIGGKVWHDKYRFGQLINTALRLRFVLAVIAILVVTPILLWMLIKNGASPLYASLITIVVLIGLNFQLTTVVLVVVPRLHSQISRVRNLDLVAAISRLALLGAAYLTWFNAAVAIATTSVVFGLQRLILGRWVADSIDTKAPINLEDRKFILTKVRELAPNSIFFCIQTQLSVWLISIFGNTNNVAEIGALGRIAIIFAVLASIMNSIVLPSFTRCQSRKLLRVRYFQILSLYLVFGLLLIGVSTLFPGELIWILGNKYSHLKNELTLVIISMVFTSIIDTMWSLNAAKGWVQYAWTEIPTRIVIQIALLLVLDISTLRGVIFFSIFSSISPFFVNAFLSFQGLRYVEEST
jgi:O-antigen/teichoic acid export membrane protein